MDETTQQAAARVTEAVAASHAPAIHWSLWEEKAGEFFGGYDDYARHGGLFKTEQHLSATAAADDLIAAVRALPPKDHP